MLRYLSLILSFLFINRQEALVPKKILVEHFTNTLCSVCANRNPGFKNNLNNQSDVLYLSYHPSSPYSACVLNKANTAENDSRCKHYQLFGGTPRLAINGISIPANANYNDNALFTPYTGNQSSFELKLSQYKTANEVLLKVTVILKDSFTGTPQGKLYVLMAEDSISYNAPNGETEHLNVFRDAATAAGGDLIQLPNTIGDSVVLRFSMPINQSWNSKRLFAATVLSDANGQYLQAEENKTNDSDMSLNLNSISLFPEFKIYPNPVNAWVRVEWPNEEMYSAELLDMNGRTIMKFKEGLYLEADLSHLDAGVYYLKIGNVEVYKSKMIVKD